MLLENAKHGVAHQFGNFYFDPVNKVHVVWFYPMNSGTLQQQLANAEEVLNDAE